MNMRPCPLCNGPANKLGRLGNLNHYRCTACGMTFSRKIKVRS